ncbi:MAG: methyltransferase domain-containing protein [Rhodospirillaceae bacterium]|nr:methyltransferase domain-containing protein [Rhodospirillaceae bacterium]
MPSETELKAYYDRPAWFEGGERGGYKNYDEQTDWSLSYVTAIIESFKATEGLSVLDVGCGYGSHLALAAARGWKCFGVEVSDHARKVAQERLGGGAYIVEAVDDLIPHEFDLVLILDTLEHLPSPYKLLYSLFSIGAITAKTRVVIATPNAGSADARAKPAEWPYRHPPSHLIFYTAEALQYLLQRLHFANITVQGFAPNDKAKGADDLANHAGLLVTASGSDFTEFMRERYVPGTWSKIAEYEHIPRYNMALDLVAGKQVLDFGCGTGYGAAMMATRAASVTGLDIDAAAITWATRTHRNPALTFIRRDDLGASLPEKSFDVVTCFEMIEHVDHATQKAVIASFARLVKDNGVLLISTPNPETTKKYGENPYHIREMNEPELRDLLGPHFPTIQVLRQYVRTGVTLDQAGDAHTLKVAFSTGDLSASANEPLAFIGVCSRSAKLPQVPSQVIFDGEIDYISAYMRHQNDLNKARLDAYLKSELAYGFQKQTAGITQERDHNRKALQAALHEKNLLITAEIEAARQREVARHEKNVADKERVEAQHVRDVALHEKNLAVMARDEALHARNLATMDRDAAVHEREVAKHERNLAEIERTNAISQRDVAHHERNLAQQERDTAIHERNSVVAEISHVREAYHHLWLAQNNLITQRDAELASPRFLFLRFLMAAKARLKAKLQNLLPRPEGIDFQPQDDETRYGIDMLMQRLPAQAASAEPLLCSLLIPTKDGGELFKRVVAGLQRQTIWSQVEFIIIDSGSTDDTVAVAAAAGAKVISIPPSEFNHGATRDRAIAEARCERIVLTVQDATPAHDAVLEKLVATLDDAAVAGAYAKQIPQADADYITKRNLNSWLTGRSMREVRSLASPVHYDAFSAMDKYLFCNFDNVCSIIRKSVWEQERFGRINFGEDIDWAERVLKAGHKIVYEPEAAVVHSHDRPLAYEYKRTYVCHRKLYGQFSLHLVQARRQIPRAWLFATMNDMRFVMRVKGPWREKLRLLCKIPVLNAMQVVGQYRGARDEKRGRENKVKGV